MAKQAPRIIISVFLIALGVLILLNNLHMLPFDINQAEWFWMAMFGLGGLAFLSVFVSNVRDHWWAVIPSFTLLGLAGLIGVPAVQNELGGGFFLGMIGLSFWVIYITHREMWWAVIPGGVLVTLAFVASFASIVEGREGGMGAGGFFFLGLALTFALVYILPTPEGRMRWAAWPAGILGLMGLLLIGGMSEAARFVWPLALILFGGGLVFRALRPRER